MFATGLTCSNEQLIMDEEISAMSLRIAGGVRVDEDTLPVDLIKQLGPKGDYLTAGHTLHWLRSEEYLKPRVSVRGPYASWQAAGSKDSYTLSKERVRRLEAKGIGSPLDPDRAAALAEVLAVFVQPA
jgi:trimethylamine--corrinoid protein Co-methyltransferase